MGDCLLGGWCFLWALQCVGGAGESVCQSISRSISLLRERGVCAVLRQQHWAQTRPRTRENRPTPGHTSHGTQKQVTKCQTAISATDCGNVSHVDKLNFWGADTVISLGILQNIVVFHLFFNTFLSSTRSCCGWNALHSCAKFKEFLFRCVWYQIRRIGMDNQNTWGLKLQGLLAGDSCSVQK